MKQKNEILQCKVNANMCEWKTESDHNLKQV